jgi:hypothetical protein
MTETLAKDVVETESVLSSNLEGKDFADSLKNDAGDGKDFADSLKEDVSEGKDFADSLKEYASAERETEQPVDTVKGIPLENWTGDRGNSEYKPDLKSVPLRFNYEWKTHTWGDIYQGNLDFSKTEEKLPANKREQLINEYTNLAKGDKGILFVNGEPDFSKIAYDTVTIDNFSSSRYGSGANMDLADEALAKKWGMTKDEIYAWRNERELMWHERSDMKTLDLVPHDIHENINHQGGISEKKEAETKL